MPLAGTKLSQAQAPPGMAGTRVAGPVATPEVVTIPRRLVTPSQALVEDFENVLDWTVGGGAAILADTTNYITGTQGLQITTASGAAGYASKTVNWDLSACQGFRLSFYTASASGNLSSVMLRLYNGNFINSYRCDSSIPNSTGWWHLNFARSNFTVGDGTPDWNSAFIRVRVQITPNALKIVAGTFDEFRAGALPRPVVCLVFDDCRTSQYTKAFPIMKRYGIRGTCYVVTNNAGSSPVTYMSKNNLWELYDAGWDIANHTMSHTDLTTLTEAQQEAELLGAQQQLDAWGFKRASRHVAYPAGLFDANTITAMAATGMKSGRNTRTDVWQSSGSAAVPAYWIPCKGYLTSTVALATATGWVDTCINQGAVCIIQVHHLVASAPGATEWTIDNFRSLIEYIAAKHIPCVTISELYDQMTKDLQVPVIWP